MFSVAPDQKPFEWTTLPLLHSMAVILWPLQESRSTDRDDQHGSIRQPMFSPAMLWLPSQWPIRTIFSQQIAFTAEYCRGEWRPPPPPEFDASIWRANIRWVLPEWNGEETLVLLWNNGSHTTHSLWPVLSNYLCCCCFHLTHGSQSSVVSGFQCLWLIHNKNRINVHAKDILRFS